MSYIWLKWTLCHHSPGCQVGLEGGQIGPKMGKSGDRRAKIYLHLIWKIPDLSFLWLILPTWDPNLVNWPTNPCMPHGYPTPLPIPPPTPAMLLSSFDLESVGKNLHELWLLNSSSLHLQTTMFFSLSVSSSIID